MSCYKALTKHPLTKRYKMAEWVDDHYGTHLYAVRFDDAPNLYFDPRKHDMPTKIVSEKNRRKKTDLAKHDPVNSPSHYTWIPGIECQDVVKHLKGMKSHATKYILRAGRKSGVSEREDINKAIKCLQIHLTTLCDADETNVN